HKIVPNRIVYPALAYFAVAVVAGDFADLGVELIPALIGLAAYAGPLFLLALAVPRGMGMGDVKLVALIGFVLGSLGLRYVAVAAALGILTGGVGAIAAAVILGYGRRQQIPFGPYLALGAVGAALAAPSIADAYLSLLT
ncbi:MAG: prepilin peptidase, partial [Actinomycetota bacterium]